MRKFRLPKVHLEEKDEKEGGGGALIAYSLPLEF